MGCVCSALERERASCTVEAATFVKLSGDACFHTHRNIECNIKEIKIRNFH